MIWSFYILDKYIEINIVGLLIIIVSYLSVIFFGWFVVWWILKIFKELKREEVNSLKNAGVVIGILERILALTLILTNQYTVVGLVFAAKSIVRFPQLSDKKFAEYFIVGTLASFLFALITGLFARWLLNIYSLNIIAI